MTQGKQFREANYLQISLTLFEWLQRAREGHHRTRLRCGEYPCRVTKGSEAKNM